MLALPVCIRAQRKRKMELFEMLLIMFLLFLGITVFLSVLTKQGRDSLAVIINPLKGLASSLISWLSKALPSSGKETGVEVFGYYIPPVLEGNLLAQFPKMLYIDESTAVSIRLPAKTEITGHFPLVRVSIPKIWTTPSGQLIGLSLDKLTCIVELQAGGMEVSGERIQTRPYSEATEGFDFSWVVHPLSSGNHLLILITTLNYENHIVFGPHIHRTKVRVNKLNGFTGEQVWRLTLVSGFVTGLLGLAQVLHSLGVF